jgi:hypothetical protein
MNMKVNIDINFKKFDNKYRELITLAVLRMEEVLASPIFFEMLSDEIANSRGLEGELSKWKRATVHEIHEALYPIVLNLHTYYTSDNVIGFGYASSKDIYINTKYLSKYTVDDPYDLMEVGSNLLHEHSHDCGFDHDFKATDRRRNSLSYILNRAYERAFKRYYGLSTGARSTVVYKVPWWRKLWNWLS